MLTRTKPKMPSRVGHVDLDTGEVMEHATMALILRRGRNGFGKRWFAMAQDPIGELAERRKEVGAEGLAVFLLICSALDYENEIIISQSDVAARLGMAKQSVSRAFKKLLAIGVIKESRRFGNMKSYQLNPTFGWKGKGPAHIKALQAA